MKQVYARQPTQSLSFPLSPVEWAAATQETPMETPCTSLYKRTKPRFGANAPIITYTRNDTKTSYRPPNSQTNLNFILFDLALKFTLFVYIYDIFQAVITSGLT